MSYSKAGKARDFTPSTAPHRGWQASIHTALVGICFAFVARGDLRPRALMTA